MSTLDCSVGVPLGAGYNSQCLVSISHGYLPNVVAGVLFFFYGVDQGLYYKGMLSFPFL